MLWGYIEKSVLLFGLAEEDKGEVVNNNVVVVVAGVLARVQQRRYLLKILMRILISTTQQIWRPTEAALLKPRVGMIEKEKIENFLPAD